MTSTNNGNDLHSQVKLKRPLPENRTFAQVLNHYTIEKSIALRLKAATREERKKIYPSMYEELLEKVPDHSRLAGTDSPEKIVGKNRKKIKLVDRFINDTTTFVEFAPGDCSFVYLVCSQVKKAYAIDISDQRSNKEGQPANFTLEIYNGYDLTLPDTFSDVVFSDQFIEHLHPEDIDCHLSLAFRILKKGGRYIFRTPHRFFGPWDISGYFSDVAEGFHLKEWTFTELDRCLKTAGFKNTCGMKRLKKKYAIIPMGYCRSVELLLKNVPARLRKRISRLFIPMQLIIVAEK